MTLVEWVQSLDTIQAVIFGGIATAWLVFPFIAIRWMDRVTKLLREIRDK